MNEAPKGKIGRLPKAVQEQVNRRLANGEKGRTVVACLRACLKIQRGSVSAKTLRAARLLPVAGVDSAVAARCGDAPASSPWPPAKSAAAEPLSIFRQALNALPEVQAVLAAEFAGKPIREQNLSDWRKHGHKQWLWRQQAWERAQAMTSAPPGQAGVSPQPSTSHEPVTDQMAGWVTAHYLLALRKLVATSADGGPDLKTLRAFLQDVVAVRRGDHRAARMQIDLERRGSRGEIIGEL
jgi:hypothetical protein